jgi:hypothetical protein
VQAAATWDPWLASALHIIALQSRRRTKAGRRSGQAIRNSSIVELPQPVFDDVVADQASLRFSDDDRLAGVDAHHDA